MEKTLTAQEIAEHYGYTQVANSRGYWEINDETLKRLSKLPEILDPKKKFRVTFDYDPEYPKALLQVFVDGLDGYQRTVLMPDFEMTQEEFERPLTTEEEAWLAKNQNKFLYSMGKDEDTGTVKMYPMNGDEFISIHSEEEARYFTDHLMDCFRKE